MSLSLFFQNQSRWTLHNKNVFFAGFWLHPMAFEVGSHPDFRSSLDPSKIWFKVWKSLSFLLPSFLYPLFHFNLNPLQFYHICNKARGRCILRQKCPFLCRCFVLLSISTWFIFMKIIKQAFPDSLEWFAFCLALIFEQYHIFHNKPRQQNGMSPLFKELNG